jgi:acylphosphatase
VTETRRLRIRGVVQGVGYRAWLVGCARGLGIAGWVRNRSDGSVEAAVQGPAEALDALLSRCRRGPPAARVDDIACAPDEGSYTGFDARPTE